MKIIIGMHDESTFSVRTEPFMPEFANVLANAPQKQWRADQRWLMPTTEPNIRFLASNVCGRYPSGTVDLSDNAKAIMTHALLSAKVLDVKAKRRAEYTFKDAVPYVPKAEFEFKTEPKKHQLVAWDASRGTECFAYFMEMGTGKTKAAIDRAAFELVKRVGVERARSPLPALEDKSTAASEDRKTGTYRVLVIAPKSVVRNWGRELIKHCSIPFVYEAMLGEPSKRLQSLLAVLKDRHRFKVFGINWDALGKFKDFIKMCKFDLIIGDESTRIKSRGAKRTLAAIECAKSAKARMILSGQPITKNILDLWSQFEFLSPDEPLLGYDNFHAFSSRYTYRDTYSGKLQPANLEELKEKVARHAIIVKKKECLDLPDKNYVQEFVTMSDEQRQVYQELFTDFMAKLSEGLFDQGGRVSVKHILTQYLRLAQITSGFIPLDVDEDDPNPPKHREIVEFKENPKMEWLLEKVDDIVDLNDGEGTKVIIWARFVKDIETIRNKLGEANIPCVTLYGKTPDWERESAIRNFNENDGIRVFIGQQQSGGIGIDLLGSEKCPTGYEIFYSNDFSLENRSQAEDRAHRIGMHRPVTIIDVTCEGTIDQFILSRLLEKREFAEGFVDSKSMAMALMSYDGNPDREVTGAHTEAA